MRLFDNYLEAIVLEEKNSQKSGLSFPEIIYGTKLNVQIIEDETSSKKYYIFSNRGVNYFLEYYYGLTGVVKIIIESDKLHTIKVNKIKGYKLKPTDISVKSYSENIEYDFIDDDVKIINYKKDISEHRISIFSNKKKIKFRETFIALGKKYVKYSFDANGRIYSQNCRFKVKGWIDKNNYSPTYIYTPYIIMNNKLNYINKKFDVELINNDFPKAKILNDKPFLINGKEYNEVYIKGLKYPLPKDNIVKNVTLNIESLFSKEFYNGKILVDLDKTSDRINFSKVKYLKKMNFFLRSCSSILFFIIALILYFNFIDNNTFDNNTFVIALSLISFFISIFLFYISYKRYKTTNFSSEFDHLSENDYLELPVFNRKPFTFSLFFIFISLLLISFIKIDSGLFYDKDKGNFFDTAYVKDYVLGKNYIEYDNKINFTYYYNSPFLYDVIKKNITFYLSIDKTLLDNKVYIRTKVYDKIIKVFESNYYESLLLPGADEILEYRLVESVKDFDEIIDYKYELVNHKKGFDEIINYLKASFKKLAFFFTKIYLQIKSFKFY